MPALPPPFDSVRAVVFDAVGTLIHAQPTVEAAYGQWGRRYGSQLTDAEILPRFRAAFARQETLDAERSDGRTSRQREAQRWRAIVTEALPDVSQPDVVFAGLWDHFGDAKNWRVDPAAQSLLTGLRRGGLRTAVASNFDERLLAICRDLPELRSCNAVFVSSELGYRKPAAEFFAAIERALELSPDQLLLVGDHWENDFQAAKGRGWRAIWLADELQRQRTATRVKGNACSLSADESAGALSQLAERWWGGAR